MNATVTEKEIITPSEFLQNWQGHRLLTRRVIEAFPEKELFEFSIGGMRPFAELAKEMLAIAVPGLKEIVTGLQEPYEENRTAFTTKQELLDAWDEATEQINVYWQQIPLHRFRETVNLFGQYNFPAIVNITYALDNEVHHRGQGYVYLRALGIEPPAFYDRW
ncbi:MAG: damage-inducible protein DinB [Chitinophagaceae bacterium]|nr:damage-inducible protein DinB [Chitinophagaceae bacterium]MCW5927967.1 damage-inducible protein DinB [Chitinophagaceae bacterium]